MRQFLRSPNGKTTLCTVNHGLNTFCGVLNERNTFSGVCKGRRNIFFVGCYGKKKFSQCLLSFYEESFLAKGEAVSEENELSDSFCWVYNRRNTFLLGVYNRKNPFCNGWDSFCRVQMEETLYVEYLMEETLSAGVYNRVNTFSVSVMEETLSAG